MIEFICLAGIAALGFAYFGFPLSLWFLDKYRNRFSRSRKVTDPDELPEIQVVISCFNEAAIIADRIKNVLEQDYPAEKLTVLVISDASTDGTDEVVGQAAAGNERIKLFSLKENLGKNQAINAAFTGAAFSGDLLCFTDADGAFEPGAIASAAHFFSESQTGLVGGNIAYWLNGGSVNKAEGAFWRIENFLREAEGNLGVLVSCTGQFIMMRRELLLPLPPDANTDFAMPLMVLAQGYATRFDNRAVVRSLFPSDPQGVLDRRQRTVIRALTTMAVYRKSLSWRLRQVLFWHKTIRFYAFPIQIAVLAANASLVASAPSGAWRGLLALQFLFYSLAILGYLSARFDLKLPLVHLPYQFTRQNAAIFGSVISYLRGKRVSKWTPPR